MSTPQQNCRQPMPLSILFYEGASDINGNIARATHSWGQLNCIDTGVASFSLNGNRLIGLPGVGIWFPPGVEHECYNYRQIMFRVMNVDAGLCANLPHYACMIGLTDIFRSIWQDTFGRALSKPKTSEDARLCQVLVDQLKIAPSQQYFLPITDDQLLAPIINHLENNPDDNAGLAYWADKVFATERTIARRFQSTLGMSFREWRLRLRFLHSMALLNQGLSIESVALSLGYSTSSAFICMFSKFASISPERYRKGLMGMSRA